MKLIGESMTGGWLYELTKEEARLLRLAEDAANGGELKFGLAYERPTDASNLAPVFDALCLWMKLKLAINDLQQQVDRCNKVLMGPILPAVGKTNEVGGILKEDKVKAGRDEKMKSKYRDGFDATERL